MTFRPQLASAGDDACAADGAVPATRRTALTAATVGPVPKPAAVMVLAACTVLTACSGAAAGVQLPARPIMPAAITSSTALTPRQQVIAALTGYTAALSRADKSRSRPAARELLRPYLAASRIAGLVEAVSVIWARGERFYGTDVVHVSSVSIEGRRAFVYDCDDTSGMGLENSVTGQTVPGSVGVPRDNLVTRLDLVRGRWLVAFQLVEDVPCTP
jgi:hypothetical protein